MKVWNIDPQGGGIRIPPNSYPAIVAQVSAYEAQKPWYGKFKLQTRFRGVFCYLDAVENDGAPFPIGRLRYFGPNEWSMAFYTYSNEKYEPCIFPGGTWFGSIERAIDVFAMYFG